MASSSMHSEAEVSMLALIGTSSSPHSGAMLGEDSANALIGTSSSPHSEAMLGKDSAALALQETPRLVRVHHSIIFNFLPGCRITQFNLLPASPGLLPLLL